MAGWPGPCACAIAMAPPIGSLNWRLIPAARHLLPNPPLADVPAESLAAFRSDAFEFAPLLPDEDAPLSDRVAALAAWSGGFLYGVGTGASEQAIAAAGDVGEFLSDLADIARAQLEPGRAADAGEGDFVELFEFVRAGAQLTFDELAGARADAPG